MGGLHCSLGHRVGHQEEIEFAVNHFTLLHEPTVHVGSLRRVYYSSLSAGLEESLAHSFVHNNEGVLGCLQFSAIVQLVLLANYFVQLLQLMGDDLGSHRVANSVSVDEDVVRQLAVVVVSEGLESTLEVELQHARVDDFLAFLGLGTGLGVVLAHVLVVGGAEPNDTLLALVAHVDTHQHGFLGDFVSEVESPEISAEFGIDLSEDVDVNTVIILLDGLGGHELGNDGAVGVDLVLQSCVEVFLLDGVGHDDQEEVEVLRLLTLLGGLLLLHHELRVVVVNGILESLNP